ncbi:MAG TPA: GTP cyclohydrolase I FolE [Candidatus Binatia bacterium]|jgi:GTP cyclohydrolase I|nr:GTP cyclohydrolase I FolE [Candidatus Binatia bacterium]
MPRDSIEIIRLEQPQHNGNGRQIATMAPPRSDQYEKVKLITRSLLSVLGQDPDRDGLRRTPQRVARMYEELLSGYDVKIGALVNGALFDVDYQEMIVVKDIEFYSLCEHHLLPFFGRAHVGYVPGHQVIGLSKIPRIIDMYARRLQVQERMTKEIANQLTSVLQPRGVAVVLEGTHLCLAMRGVRQEGVRMRTSAMRGQFQDDAALRGEFLQHLQHISAP